MNKILSFFGLVTIKRAKHINKEIVCAYARQIREWAKQDFNAKPNIDINNLAAKMAEEQFDFCIKIPDKTFNLVNKFEEITN